jgi:hypothetical protein
MQTLFWASSFAPASKRSFRTAAGSSQLEAFISAVLPSYTMKEKRHKKAKRPIYRNDDQWGREKRALDRELTLLSNRNTRTRL